MKVYMYQVCKYIIHDKRKKQVCKDFDNSVCFWFIIQILLLSLITPCVGIKFEKLSHNHKNLQNKRAIILNSLKIKQIFCNVLI